MKFFFTKAQKAFVILNVVKDPGIFNQSNLFLKKSSQRSADKF